MTKLVLLGPPGCGKGTQSSLLVSHHNFTQLSTGELLRIETQKKKSDYGKQIASIMERGELVPDTIVIDIIVQKMKSLKNSSVIFDGFPRNINQAKALDESLDKIKISLDYAILIDVSFDILQERINKRVIESNKNSQRVDDNAKTLIKRIDTYKVSTLPLVDYYKKKGILYKIDGMLEIETVNQEIISIIK